MTMRHTVCRNKAKQAIALLMQDDEERAISILNTERSLAWVRDDTSGAYPLHIAAWRVRIPPALWRGCREN